MICLETVKRFCKEYWKIENYQEAVNDTTQTWHCHHRYEIEYNLSKIDLQALGFYFDRPSYELIFLTSEEHNKLHHGGKYVSEETKEKIRKANKGKKRPKEFCEMMSELMAGENNPMYGKEAPNKGKHHTEETKEKISTSMKGKLSGENHPMYGKEGYWKGKEGPNKGKHLTEEWKANLTKYQITAEELYDLYVVRGFSQQKIAELYGCSQACIWLKLKKYNIKK